jgi:hypothetical protein
VPALVIAVIAVIAGVRAGIWRIALPSRNRSVAAASQPSTLTASEPYASATQTESNPAASARWTRGSTDPMEEPEYPRFSPRRMSAGQRRAPTGAGTFSAGVGAETGPSGDLRSARASSSRCRTVSSSEAATKM